MSVTHISVMNQGVLRQTLAHPLDRPPLVPTVAILACDKERKLPYLKIAYPDMVSLLRLKFDDVLGQDDRRLTQEQAAQIVDFIHTYGIGDYQLILACRGGISRSAGMAAACAHALGKNETYFWTHPPYMPNEYVYATLRAAFGCPTTSEEVRQRIQENIDAIDNYPGHWLTPDV